MAARPKAHLYWHGADHCWDDVPVHQKPEHPEHRHAPAPQHDDARPSLAKPEEPLEARIMHWPILRVVPAIPLPGGPTFGDLWELRAAPAIHDQQRRDQ